MTEATKGAINAPLRTMQVCVESMGLMKAMAENGLKASVSDAGVGALCARTGAIGAYLNVRINCVGLDDEAFKTKVLKRSRRPARQSGDAGGGSNGPDAGQDLTSRLTGRNNVAPVRWARVHSAA